jgi:hypothetical protein
MEQAKELTNGAFGCGRFVSVRLTLATSNPFPSLACCQARRPRPAQSGRGRLVQTNGYDRPFEALEPDCGVARIGGLASRSHKVDNVGIPFSSARRTRSDSAFNGRETTPPRWYRECGGAVSFCARGTEGGVESPPGQPLCIGTRCARTEVALSSCPKLVNGKRSWQVFVGTEAVTAQLDGLLGANQTGPLATTRKPSEPASLSIHSGQGMHGLGKGTPWRRRAESNRRTGLCRPLPKPLGHAAAPSDERAASLTAGVTRPRDGLPRIGDRRASAADGTRARRRPRPRRRPGPPRRRR